MSCLSQRRFYLPVFQTDCIFTLLWEKDFRYITELWSNYRCHMIQIFLSMAFPLSFSQNTKNN